MAQPYPITPSLVIYFNNGATFGYPFIIGDTKNGKIGINTMSDTATADQVVDFSSQCVKASLTGGYNLLQQTFQAGQATFRIVDPNGDFNPQNTASPYYGKLVPLRKIRFGATYGTNSYFLFSGYITAYNYSYPKNQDIGYVDITAADGFRLLNLAGITTVAGTSAGQTTGQRINSILDQVNFPSSMRNIDTGQTTVQADPATVRTALNAIRNCEFSEQGAFYFTGAGNATFLSRLSVEKKAAATPAYFNNDGTGIGYYNLLPQFDDKLIINQATINRVGGTAQSYADSASVSKYFPHSVNYDNLIVQTDADSLNIARAYVATRAETSLRIDEMVLDLTTPNYDAGIQAALGYDYFQQVRIVNNGQDATGGGVSKIDKVLQVVGIAHDITPNAWKTTFTLSEPIIDAFIIGSSTYGIIGVNEMTY